MILAYQNLLKDATITATNADPNYPVANIAHRWKKRVYKATVQNVTITSNFSEPEKVHSIILVYHNADTIQSKLYLGGSLVGTWNGAVAHGDLFADKVEIIISSTQNVVIGSVYIGPSFQCGKSADQDMPLMSTDEPTFSSDGQVSGRRGSVLRGGSIEIPLLDSDEREEIELAYRLCGLTEPFFLDLWDGFEPIYGVFTSDLSVTHHADGDTVRFDFQEVN